MPYTDEEQLDINGGSKGFSAPEAGKPPFFLKFRSSKGFIGMTAFVAAFTDGFLFSAVVPVLPYSLVDRTGVPEEHVQFWCSFLLMTFGTAMALGAPVAGWFADHSSSRQAPLLTGLGLAFAASLAFCFGQAPWVLVIARIFQGFAASIIYTAGLALIADTVPAEEVGSWMGFVFSGMNGGALCGPSVAGALYTYIGYYAIWGLVLGVIGLDLVLRLGMIEKSRARKWLKPRSGLHDPRTDSEEDPLCPEEADTEARDNRIVSRHRVSSYGTSGVESPFNDPTGLQAKHTSWFMKHAPAMATLLSSPRILAAIYGAFTFNTLAAAFDGVLTIFVKRTFHWSSSGAGLVFLALTATTPLGAFIGYLSDRFGNRFIALSGFGLTVPSLALLGVVTDGIIQHEVGLIILLVAIGIGLNLMIVPLAADMFDEVENLAAADPSVFGKKGAYARAYSLFDFALGISTAAGPVWAGAFYEGTNWQVMAGSLALICAIGGVPVFWFTGDGKGKGRNGKKDLE